MLTIFDYINSILYKRSNIDVNIDDEDSFSGYMVNRWLSMYSSEVVQIINETSNRYGQLFESKSDQYLWMQKLIPRRSFRRISYIKKKKEEVSTKDREEAKKEIELLAKNYEISQREVELYMTQNS